MSDIAKFNNMNNHQNPHTMLQWLGQRCKSWLFRISIDHFILFSSWKIKKTNPAVYCKPNDDETHPIQFLLVIVYKIILIPVWDGFFIKISKIRHYCTFKNEINSGHLITKMGDNFNCEPKIITFKSVGSSIHLVIHGIEYDSLKYKNA